MYIRSKRFKFYLGGDMSINSSVLRAKVLLAVSAVLFIAFAENKDGRTPLSLSGWQTWPKDGITIKKGGNGNECIVNTTSAITAGFKLDTNLHGKTLVLIFADTDKSDLSEKRMVKMTYNNDDRLLPPDGVVMIDKEYLSVEDALSKDGIKYVIPEDFDGKIGFVFYEALLKDLKIRVYTLDSSANVETRDEGLNRSIIVAAIIGGICTIIAAVIGYYAIKNRKSDPI